MSDPTEWISPGFFVHKDNGKVRLVTDYSGINKYIERPVHPFSSPLDILKGLKPDSKVFIKLDLVQGYFQIPLDESCTDLTTFLLPGGRFKYLHAPMGLNPCSDEFCFKTDMSFEDLDLLKIIDDMLIQARTTPEALAILCQVLIRCREHNITLFPSVSPCKP